MTHQAHACDPLLSPDPPVVSSRSLKQTKNTLWELCSSPLALPRDPTVPRNTSGLPPNSNHLLKYFTTSILNNCLFHVYMDVSVRLLSCTVYNMTYDKTPEPIGII